MRNNRSLSLPSSQRLRSLSLFEYSKMRYHGDNVSNMSPHMTTGVLAVQLVTIDNGCNCQNATPANGIPNPPILKVTGEHYHLTWTPQVRYFLMVAMVLVILFTITGNLFTLIAIKTAKRLRSISNIYIASLAFADLLVGSLPMTIMLVYSVIYQGYWPFSESLCYLWHYLDFLTCSASLTNICVIAYDRCQTVSRPLKALCTRTKRKACYLIGVAWVVPVIGWGIFFAIVKYFNESTLAKGDCHLLWRPRAIVVLFSILLIYAPVIATLILFVRIIKALKGHTMAMQQNMRQINRDLARMDSDEAISITSIPSYHRVSINSTCTTQGQNNRCSLLRNPLDKTKKYNRSQSTIKVMYTPTSILTNCQENSNADDELCQLTNGKLRSTEFRTKECVDATENGRVDKGTHITRDNVTACNGDVKVNFCDDAVHRYVALPRENSREYGETFEPTSAAEPPSSPSAFENTQRHMSLRSFSTESSVVTPKLDDLKETSFNFPNVSENDINENKEIETVNGALGSGCRSGSRDTEVSPRNSLSADIACLKVHTYLARIRPQGEREARGQRLSIDKLRLLQQFRASRTLGIIMAFIMLCWLPYSALWIVEAFCANCIPQYVFDIFVWLNYVNSAFNPILYCLCNPCYRKAFKSMICRKGCCFCK